MCVQQCVCQFFLFIDFSRFLMMFSCWFCFLILSFFKSFFIVWYKFIGFNGGGLYFFLKGFRVVVGGL